MTVFEWSLLLVLVLFGALFYRVARGIREALFSIGFQLMHRKKMDKLINDSARPSDET